MILCVLGLIGCDDASRPLNKTSVRPEALPGPQFTATAPRIVVAPTIHDLDQSVAEPIVGGTGILSSDSRDTKAWDATIGAGFGAIAGNIQFASESLLTPGEKKAPFEQHLAAGIQLLNSGKLREAAEKFVSAQAAKPDDYRGYFFEAVCLAQLDELPRAVAAMDLAVGLAPREMELYIHRGNLRLRQKEYGLAADDFSRVAAVQPQNVAALLNRAVANFHRRRPKDIIVDTTAVIELRKDVPDAYLLRALGNVMSGEPARARRDFDAAVSAGLAPQAVDTWRSVFYRDG